MVMFEIMFGMASLSICLFIWLVGAGMIQRAKVIFLPVIKSACSAFRDLIFVFFKLYL